MTTITATLTITIDGDADTFAAVAGHLADWLRGDGAMVTEAAMRDAAAPPYDDDWNDGDTPSDKMLAYDAWNSSDWRMNVTIDPVSVVTLQLPLFADDAGE